MGAAPLGTAPALTGSPWSGGAGCADDIPPDTREGLKHGRQGGGPEDTGPGGEVRAGEPTPALPIFAVLALGSLLAGRGAWLRRRQR